MAEEADVVVDPDVVRIGLHEHFVDAGDVFLETFVVGAERAVTHIAGDVGHRCVVAAERIGEVLVVVAEGREDVDAGAVTEGAGGVEALGENGHAGFERGERQRRMRFRCEERDLVGDAFVVLEQAQQSGEALIGEPRGSADAE